MEGKEGNESFAREGGWLGWVGLGKGIFIRPFCAFVAFCVLRCAFCVLRCALCVVRCAFCVLCVLISTSTSISMLC